MRLIAIKSIMEKKTLRKMTRSASHFGFTLVELVVVITILAILAVI